MRRTEELWNENGEESVVAYFKVPSQHSSEATEYNHEELGIFGVLNGRDDRQGISGSQFGRVTALLTWPMIIFNL